MRRPTRSRRTAKDKDNERGKEEVQGVFAVRNGRAVFVHIDTGIMGSTDMEVLKGVQPGDMIVTGSFSVLRTLKNSAKVTIDNSAKTPTGAGACKSLPSGRGLSVEEAGGCPA